MVAVNIDPCGGLRSLACWLHHVVHGQCEWYGQEIIFG